MRRRTSTSQSSLTTRLRKSCGRLKIAPAPSPVSISHPQAPRCSMRLSIVRPSWSAPHPQVSHTRSTSRPDQLYMPSQAPATIHPHPPAAHHPRRAERNGLARRSSTASRLCATRSSEAAVPPPRTNEPLSHKTDNAHSPRRSPSSPGASSPR